MMHGSYKPLIPTSNCTMTLTTDIEGHGYILCPMAAYVCVRVTIPYGQKIV